MDQRKTYILTCINNAISLLRPKANYTISNTDFIEWNDSRPAPTWEEIIATMNKIKAFEDSIECIELP